MKIDQVKISDLKAADYNPRQLSDKQFFDIKKSIEKFGMVEPVVVNSTKDRHNIVIGGHVRLRVCEKLGFETMPVHYVEISDLKKEKELNVRLNKNTGEFDFDLLKKNFEIENLVDWGFENFEIEKLNKYDFYDKEKIVDDLMDNNKNDREKGNMLNIIICPHCGKEIKK